jgi:hypothetical protein
MDCFAALAMTENRDTVSFSVNPLILSHNATQMWSRLKLWNESGTNRARIADSVELSLRSPQHLALALMERHSIKFKAAKQAMVSRRFP